MFQAVLHVWGARPGPKNKLFVGNLPGDVTQEMLNQVFGTYGIVTNVHILAGRAKSGQSCAFVEYSSPAEAEIALSTLHDKYEIRPGSGFSVTGRTCTPRDAPLGCMEFSLEL